MTLNEKFKKALTSAGKFVDNHKFEISLLGAVLFIIFLIALVLVLSPQKAEPAEKPAVVEVAPVATQPKATPAAQPVDKAKKTTHRDIIIGGVKKEPSVVEKTEEKVVKTAKPAEKTTKYQTEDDEKTLQVDYKEALKEFNLISGQQ